MHSVLPYKITLFKILLEAFVNRLKLVIRPIKLQKQQVSFFLFLFLFLAPQTNSDLRNVLVYEANLAEKATFATLGSACFVSKERDCWLPKRASKKTNICQCLFVPLSHFSFFSSCNKTKALFLEGSTLCSVLIINKPQRKEDCSLFCQMSQRYSRMSIKDVFDKTMQQTNTANYIYFQIISLLVPLYADMKIINITVESAGLKCAF